MKKSTQLYFKNEDSENCYPLEDHLEQAKEDGLAEVTLLKAVPDFDNKDHVWCSDFGDVADRDECRQLCCGHYEPSHAKGGPCKHRGLLYQHGEEETFKVK